MAISLIASDTVEASGTSAVVNNVPAGTVNDDFLIWQVSNTTTTIPATPAGWTLTASGGVAADMLVVWYRKAASEPANYSTGTLGAAGRSVGLMTTWRGVDTTTPLDVATPIPSTGSTAVACPAITPVTAGAWVIGLAGANVALGVINTTYSSSNLTAVDAQKTSTSGSATNNVGGIGHFIWSSGAFTPAFSTSNASVRTVGATMALRPAAGAAAPPFELLTPTPSYY